MSEGVKMRNDRPESNYRPGEKGRMIITAKNTVKGKEIKTRSAACCPG